MNKPTRVTDEYCQGFITGFSKALSLLSHLSRRNMSIEKIVMEMNALFDDQIRPWVNRQGENNR